MPQHTENLSAAEISGADDEWLDAGCDDDGVYPPDDWFDAYSEIEQGRWDDDPNPYHGDYSEM